MCLGIQAFAMLKQPLILQMQICKFRFPSLVIRGSIIRVCFLQNAMHNMVCPRSALGCVLPVIRVRASNASQCFDLGIMSYIVFGTELYHSSTITNTATAGSISGRKGIFMCRHVGRVRIHHAIYRTIAKTRLR